MSNFLYGPRFFDLRGVNSYYAEVVRVDPRIVHRITMCVSGCAAEVERVADCQVFE